MAASGLAAAERQALADTLDEVGPDAPTLCAGWTAADLAAHLVVRERRPDTGPGLVVPFAPLRQWTERVRTGYRDGTPYEDLVARVRAGSPLTRLPVVEEAMNLVEFAVHHEDVRRGRPGWQPRELPAAYDEALWSRLTRMAPLLLRRLRGLPVGLATPDGRSARLAGATDGGVVMTGEPLELLLYLMGRRDAARVELTGSEEGKRRLAEANLGL